eukprot:CFRG1629T1
MTGTQSNIPGKLFVGRIPLDATDDDLKAAFEKFGHVESGTIARDKNTKASRKFGFVSFTDYHSVDKALNAGKAFIKGIQVDFKRHTPKDPTTGQLISQTEKIFIGRVSSDATEEGLRDYFSTWGTIVKVALFKERGFAFVTYDAVECVNYLLSSHDPFHMIAGRKCEVKRAEDRRDTPSSQPHSTNDFSRVSIPGHHIPQPGPPLGARPPMYNINVPQRGPRPSLGGRIRPPVSLPGPGSARRAPVPVNNAYPNPNTHYPAPGGGNRPPVRNERGPAPLRNDRRPHILRGSDRDRTGPPYAPAPYARPERGRSGDNLNVSAMRNDSHGTQSYARGPTARNERPGGAPLIGKPDYRDTNLQPSHQQLSQAYQQSNKPASYQQPPQSNAPVLLPSRIPRQNGNDSQNLHGPTSVTPGHTLPVGTPSIQPPRPSVPSQRGPYSSQTPSYVPQPQSNYQSRVPQSQVHSEHNGYQSNQTNTYAPSAQQPQPSTQTSQSGYSTSQYPAYEQPPLQPLQRSTYVGSEAESQSYYGSSQGQNQSSSYSQVPASQAPTPPTQDYSTQAYQPPPQSSYGSVQSDYNNSTSTSSYANTAPQVVPSYAQPPAQQNGYSQPVAQVGYAAPGGLLEPSQAPASGSVDYGQGYGQSGGYPSTDFSAQKYSQPPTHSGVYGNNQYGQPASTTSTVAPASYSTQHYEQPANSGSQSYSYGGYKPQPSTQHDSRNSGAQVQNSYARGGRYNPY